MPANYQKIFIEEVIPDWLRANLLTLPDSTIISSATSNYQKKPSALVLLDNKYALASVMSIELERSRQVASNTVRITAMNIDTRYSAANKHKLDANVPISVYFGYDEKYLQKYQGFIDTVSMSTIATGSTITINCRDRAKMFIEDTISCGVYSMDSSYLGEGDWHFELKVRTDGKEYKAPRKWKVSEIMTDVCYVMGLKDLAEHVTVTEVWTGTGYDYIRNVEFRPEFEINIDPVWDRDLVTNFIEEHPLDCLSKLAQCVVHEAIFDTDGRLVVRPVRKANSPVAYYFTEERDISSITEDMNDDDVVNVVSVIGQTANETSIIYPFAAVAVVETIEVSKGQDIYGQALEYPMLVSQESVDSLHNHMIYAPVIYPGGQTFLKDDGTPDPRSNPENAPQFDTRVHYPNFANGYKKQVVMEGSCPIVTDTADWAPVGNRRRWWFYGAKEEAVTFETQPIMLRDRFGKAMTVICKERSQDDDLIKKCGNRPFKPEVIDNSYQDVEDPTNIPQDVYSYDVKVDGNGAFTYDYQDKIDATGFTPIYNGLTPIAGSYVLYGYQKTTDVPETATLPPSMTVAQANEGAYKIMSFNVQNTGASEYSDISDVATLIHFLILAQVTKSLVIKKFRDSGTGTEMEIVDPGNAGDWNIWWLNYDSIEVITGDPTTWIPSVLCVNCQLDTTNTAPDGSYGLVIMDGGSSIPVTLPPASEGAYWIQVSQRTVIVKYPVVTVSESPAMMTDRFWESFIWMQSMDIYIDLIKQSRNKQLKVMGSTIIQSYYAYGADPDTNCIYWKWKGGYFRNDSGRSGVGWNVHGKKPSWEGAIETPDANAPQPNNPPPTTPVIPGGPAGTTPGETPEPYYDLSDGTKFGAGYDWEGNPRVLITKDEFYKLASDPNVTIIEITTAGVDHRSSAELVFFNESCMEAFGYNAYGNMEAEFEEMMDQIKQMMMWLGIALILIGIALMIETSTDRPVTGQTTSPGSHSQEEGSGEHSHTTAGLAHPNPSSVGTVAEMQNEVQGLIAIILGLLLLTKDYGSGLGRNISKVMEDMTGRVTGIRREEIHLNHNAAQAATYQITKGLDYVKGLWHERLGDMKYMAPFGYAETAAEGEEPLTYWVYIMDLTKPNASGVAFPAGCWVTSFGWETPEVGDRNFIDYYENGGKSSKTLAYKFTIEGFGDDELAGYSAEYLLKKRFSNRGGFGIPVEPDDDWMQSAGYELLVDRSHTEVSVTDSGLWYDFFERREDFRPRLYKFIAVCVYSYREGTGLDPTTATVCSGTPDDTKVFATGPVKVVPTPTPTATIPYALPDPTPVDYASGIYRWGFWVSRGINPAWYSRFRWLEDKVEQNYLGFRVLYSGQQQTVTHILNNYRYSDVVVDIRIWGKAYGKFAPTIIYYKETDQLSEGTYGKREMRLENDCINDYRVAKYIANMLASMAATTYSIETTGKPHVKEGDIIHIKEETTGAAAGMFRTWENSFIAPIKRPCTLPANQLASMELMGITNPTCTCPTYGNNVLIGSGMGTSGTNPSPTRLIEVDKASNPIWYAEVTSSSQASFVMRWDAGTENNLYTQEITIVGMREAQTVYLIDYGIASGMRSFFLPGEILCGAMDEEKRFLWVGHTTGLSCIDLYLMTVLFTENIGEVRGLGVASWQVWDQYTRDYQYQNCGAVLALRPNDIVAYQNFDHQWNRNKLGPLVGSYTGFMKTNPVSMEYSKIMDEAVIVNASSADYPATIEGIQIEINCDIEHPELGIDVDFAGAINLWNIDFMQDAEMIHSFPNSAARKIYIDRFFSPVHAIRDIVRDLTVTDTVHNKVYKINPSGKFYITKISDGYQVSDQSTAYTSRIEAVTIDAAAPLMLTNFGKNFVQEKTDDQIEAESAIGMGRIVSMRPHDKYLVKLLTSDTVVEAYNNSNATDLRVGDTVIVGYGIGGGGRCSIMGRKSLWDWTSETGDQYVVVDATSIEVSKYGQSTSTGTTSAGTSADYTSLSAKIRMLEQRMRILGSHHGLVWLLVFGFCVLLKTHIG